MTCGKGHRREWGDAAQTSLARHTYHLTHSLPRTQNLLQVLPHNCAIFCLRMDCSSAQLLFACPSSVPSPQRQSVGRTAAKGSSPLGRAPLPLLLLLTVLSAPSSAKPAPFDRGEYPSIDLRLLDWPLAQRAAPSAPFTQMQCYIQLDRSFVDPGALYRLNNTNKLDDRACLLRIPSRSRMTVVQMHTSTPRSYVTVLAGSSQVFMPLRTGRIYEAEPEMYGPWHVPCKQAYMVFSSKGTELEWVDFRLSAETEEDRQMANPRDCDSEGAVNHAELEYKGDEWEEEQ